MNNLATSAGKYTGPIPDLIPEYYPNTILC